jgi:hypothetical protein
MQKSHYLDYDPVALAVLFLFRAPSFCVVRSVAFDYPEFGCLLEPW